MSSAPASPASLYAWMLLGAPRLVGQIIKQSNGDVGLQYDPAWVASGFALSADMPLGGNTFTPVHRLHRLAGAPGALDDARPDRWGEKVIRYLYKPGASVYDNLYFAGDERFGALGVSSSATAYVPFMERPLPRLHDAQNLSDAAKVISSGEGELDAQKRAIIGAAGSLGGAKPKAVITIAGEEWVLKFSNGEPYDLPLAEHACMTLATRAGLHMATTQMVPLLAESAVAVKRFDRQAGERRHCISASTLLRSEVPASITPEYGYPQLARALRRSGNVTTVDAQLHELFGRMVFNILIANTDDHEKNHALLCQMNGRTMTLELSPAYDVVTTGSGAVDHEFMISDTSHAPDLKAALSVAADFGLTPDQAAAVVARIATVVDEWVAHFQALGVTERDIRELSAFIDHPDLLEQRRTAMSHVQTLMPPAGRSPRRGGAFKM